MTTNIALVDVDDGEIEIGAIARYDRDQHRQLEEQYAATHVFRRRKNTLECVRLDTTAPPVGDSFQTLPARAVGHLLKVLIEEAVATHLVASGAQVEFVNRRPLVFVSLEPKYDVAFTLFGKKGGGQLPFHVRRGFKLEARTVFPTLGRRIGLAIDAQTVTQLDGSCADLLEDGFDLRGLYVKEPLRPTDRFVQNARATLGVVQHVDGTRLLLGDDRRRDRREYEASELFLDVGPAALVRLADHYLGPAAHEKLWGERGSLASGINRWRRVSMFQRWLSRARLEISPGVCTKVRDWLHDGHFLSTDLSMPRFLVGSSKIVDATKAALREGPRHVPSRLTREPVSVCVICEAQRKSDVDRFLVALRDGTGAHRALAETWRLAGVRFNVFCAENGTSGSYEDACRKAIDEGGAWDLALVQVPKGTEDAVGDENPYLVTKAKFLARGIPVQEFRDETMSKPVNQLQWALGGIALQVFAKLGGVPWLLQAPSTANHEVVLGLGSAQLGTGRFGDRERVVGLTTAFSGDGTYWLTETSRAVPYGEYEEALGSVGVAAITRVRQQMAWQSGDSVRIVFHSFKDFSGAHVEKLKAALKGLESDGFEVESSFVHIAEAHPLLLFDLEEQNRIPPRGKSIRLSENEVLVSVLGPQEVRSAELRFPRPLLIKVHRESTFKDLEFLSEQALAFASHSWRNFSPTSLPVTILYAELITKLLGRLGNLTRWDPDVLRGPSQQSMWFL